MTYEQFLKQLRRIGRQLMIGSILAATVSFTFDFFNNLTLTNETASVYKIYATLFVVGCIIYPLKDDE